MYDHSKHCLKQKLGVLMLLLIALGTVMWDTDLVTILWRILN